LEEVVSITGWLLPEDMAEENHRHDRMGAVVFNLVLQPYPYRTARFFAFQKISKDYHDTKANCSIPA
jgi:hypothetical protein